MSKSGVQKEQKDELANKSNDELKSIIREKQKTIDDNMKIMNKYSVVVQSIAVKLKETGLDLQLIGRNTERILDSS